MNVSFSGSEPNRVQDGRVQVAQRHLVLDHVVAEIVGLAVDDAGADAAREPGRRAARVVIAPVVITGEGALTIDRCARIHRPNQRACRRAGHAASGR